MYICIYITSIYIIYADLYKHKMMFSYRFLYFHFIIYSCFHLLHLLNSTSTHSSFAWFEWKKILQKYLNNGSQLLVWFGEIIEPFEGVTL